MRAALVIALKDLRQRLRDRSALVIAFVAPLVLALIISGAFGGGFTDTFEATYVVLDNDQTSLSRAFREQVLGSPELRDQIRIADARSEAEARALVRDGVIAAAFVIPDGFAGAVTSQRRAEISVLQSPDAPIGGEVAVAIARAYTDQINASRLSVLTAIRARGGALDPATAQNLAQAAAAERLPIQLVDGEIAVKKVSGASYFGPAMAIFFLFFSTSFAARSLLAEREQGTMPRILAAPVRRSSIIWGKAITGFVVGLVSLAVMFLTFAQLLNVDWGDPVTLAALSVVTVLAVMGVTAAVQSFARTQEQADSYSQVVSVLLAMIGGSFFPLFQMPDVIQRISVIAPNAWAMRGFTDVVYDGATIGDLGPHFAIILAFAVVTNGVAVMRARKLSVG